MEIKQQYLQQYLHSIAIDQLVADYQARSYLVAKEEKIGDYQADLVARKGDEVVVVEVKAGKMTPKKRQEVAAIGDYVRNRKNYKFLVVVAIPPKRKKIDIPNLDQLLRDYLVDNHQLNSKLFADTRIASVTDVVLNEVTVTETGNIAVKGNAVIEVELRYGTLYEGPNDDSITHIEVFPCSFEAVLTYTSGKQLVLSEMTGLLVDTSEYT